MATLIVFVTSLILIVGLLSYKYWETTTGKTLYGGLRSKADRFVVSQIEYQRVLLPHVMRSGKYASKTFVLHIMHLTALFALALVRTLEEYLIRSVRFIRGRRKLHRQAQKDVSPFLQKMSEAKTLASVGRRSVEKNREEH